MPSRLSNFIRHPFFQSFAYYGIAQIFMWFFHLILISIVSFIHFQLDHSLSIIENWIFDQGWEIVTVAKLLATYTIFKFIIIRTDTRKPIHDLVVRGNLKINKTVLIISAYSLFYLMTFGRPVQDDKVSIEVLKMVTSYLGIIIFFMCDILILNLVDILYPLNKKYKRVKVLVFPLLTHLFVYWSVPYARNINFQIYFIFLMLIYFSHFKKLNWTYPLLLLVTVIAPLTSVMGLDFIWGGTYSFFIMRGGLEFYHYFILVSTSILFFRYRKSE